MTYRNFGPEMLNQGRMRRQIDPAKQTMQPQQRQFKAGSLPQGAAVNDMTRELEAIANELARLKAAQAPSLRPVPSHSPAFNRPLQPAADASQLSALVQSLKNDVRSQMRDDLDLQYGRLREELDGLSSAISGTSLQHSFKDEISELVSGLETLASGNRTIQHSQHQLSNYLERELGELQHSLQGLARNESLTNLDARLDERWNSLENRWDRLEDRLDSKVNADSTVHFADISARIAALHDKMNDGGLESLENRLLMLAKSVDALAHSRSTGTSVDFNQIDKRFDELSRAVAAIGTERTSPVFDSRAADQIENAISLLSRKLELVGSMTGQNPSLEAIEAQLGQLNDRFLGLPDYLNQEPVMERIDRLAEKVSAIASPSLSPASIDALTLQINALAGEIRTKTGASPIAEGLFDRLDDRLGSIEERIQNLSFGETSPASAESAAVITALEARFAELTAYLESSQTAPVSAGASGADFDQLERKLADIARQLVQPSEHVGAPVSFERLENQIAGLASMLSENQHAVLESARKVSEEAALRFRGSHAEADNSHIVGVIAGELATLEQLTRNSNERSTTAFEGIHGALTKIADRLGVLETKPAVNALTNAAMPQMQNRLMPDSDFEVARTPASPVGGYANFEAQNDASGFDPADFDAPSVEAAESDLGNLDIQSEPAARKARSPAEMAQQAANAALRNADSQAASGSLQSRQSEEFDDVPLNPGSSVPDLNSILKRVRDQKKAAQSQTAKDVDRKDHFLSIKRAAQAAANEVQPVSSTSTTGGALGNIKALYGKFRRPILMVATAAIIAIAAIQLTRALVSSDAEQMAEAPVNAADTQAPIALNQMVTIEPASPAESAAKPLSELPDVAPQAAVPEAPEAAAPRIVGAENAPAPATELAAVSPGENSAVAAPEGINVPAEMPAVTELTPAVPAGFGPEPLVTAAKNADAKALFEVGRRLSENQSDAAILKDAFSWFSASAAQGFAPAQYRVGNMYEKGLGVDRSASEAKLWYQMAAEAGNASAMHNLAVLFASGADGTVDSESALRWFQKAADLGVGDSQFNLGVMTGKGQGVPQDLEESYKWLAILAKSGDIEAGAKRDEVAKTMRPEQLQSAKAKIELWKPQSVATEANDVSIPDDWKIAGGATASVDVKKAVKNVQLILSKLGYNVGTPDGIMGENTRKAIRAFQKKENLVVNGEIDGPLVKALLAKNG